MTIHPHHLQKRRARHVRPQPILSGGSQIGPISVVLSYAASNPSYVIGDVPHLLSRVGEVARALSSLVLSSSVSRPFCPCSVVPYRAGGLPLSSLCRFPRRVPPFCSLAREDTSLDPLEANLVAPTTLLRNLRIYITLLAASGMLRS